jgi:hypothetical protein
MAFKLNTILYFFGQDDIAYRHENTVALCRVTSSREIHELAKYVLSHPPSPFFLFFRNDIDITEDSALANIILLLSHQQYGRYRGSPVLFYEDDEMEQGCLQSELKKYIHKQEGIKPIWINPRKRNDIVFSWNEHDDGVASVYREKIIKESYYEKLVFIDSLTPGFVSRAILMIAEIENLITAQYPALINSYRQNILSASNIRALVSGQHVLTRYVADQAYFIATLQKSQEVEKILAFYQAQYEVLPLWYKQMGHLIKVVMGKRTFRSLFK